MHPCCTCQSFKTTSSTSAGTAAGRAPTRICCAPHGRTRTPSRGARRDPLVVFAAHCQLDAGSVATGVEPAKRSKHQWDFAAQTRVALPKSVQFQIDIDVRALRIRLRVHFCSCKSVRTLGGFVHTPTASTHRRALLAPPRNNGERHKLQRRHTPKLNARCVSPLMTLSP